MPNPCNGEADVQYTVPEGMSDLVLNVYDLTGKLLQRTSLPVNDGNAGTYRSRVAFAISEGMYLYILVGTCNDIQIQSNSKKLLVK